MIRVWIDEHECDVAPESLAKLPLNFDVEQLRDVEGARNGRTITLSLPASARNNAIVGSSQRLYDTERFNEAHHTLRVKQGGVTVFEGTAYLVATEVREGGGGSYTLRATEGGADWVEQLARTSLSELDIDFSDRLTPEMIASTWEGRQDVCFLPIHRNNFERHYSASSEVVAERVMLTDDYHPFLSVAAMVRKMFARCGYTLRSNFFDSELAASLYMSGDYTRTDASAVRDKCDFFARRSAPATALADYGGRVYATNSVTSHTVGPVVDTANPTAIDSNGVLMSETFSTAGSFAFDESGNIGFKPSVSAKVGFLLHAEYTSGYKILSRERFTGFDTIEGLDGVKVQFALTNTFEDRRNEVTKNFSYRAVVFNHLSGSEYRLVERLTSGEEYEMGSWSARTALVTSHATLLPTSLTLYYRTSSDAMWVRYAGDWALYDGYINETGKVDVEVDVRFPPRDVAAGEMLMLDDFWFGGATRNMGFTLGVGTTLRPYFTAVAGYGSSLTFADIAPRRLSSLDLLRAVGEMFNLVFYTDVRSRELYVEPLEEFYDTSRVFDLTSRIDTTKGVSLTDVGLDKPQDTTLAYLDADLASHELSLEEGQRLGEWSFRNPLYGTKLSTRQLGRRLFTTSCNISDVVGSAPSASIVRVGDIGNDEVSADEPFTPHILCYKGLRQLPDGEYWGARQKSKSYPYATFYDEATNLCFEERGGVEGLSRYYEPMLRRERDKEYLALDLHLSPAEIMDLFTVDDRNASIRTLFRFSVMGESSLFRLSKVASWSVESGKIHAIFERIERD